MEHRARKLTGSSEFDLATLLHPASAFAHPMDVVRDADLTLNEKRAILASWASDACAVEAAPICALTLRGLRLAGTRSWMHFASLTAKRRSMEISSALQTSAGEKTRWCAGIGRFALAQPERSRPTLKLVRVDGR